jgi:hypothetical protein
MSAERKGKVIPISKAVKRTAQRPMRCFEPDNRLFGAVLVSRRSDLGLTQQRVVAGVGRSPSWLSYYERGGFRKLPEMGDLHALCGVLGLAVHELLIEAGFIDGDAMAAAGLRRLSWRRRA